LQGFERAQLSEQQAIVAASLALKLSFILNEFDMFLMFRAFRAFRVNVTIDFVISLHGYSQGVSYRNPICILLPDSRD